MEKQINNLKVIQTIAKIAKILCKIVFVCCMIGWIGCLVGILAFSFGAGEVIKVGGITVHTMIVDMGTITAAEAYAAMILGIIACGFECIVAKAGEKYFAHELEAGTPFTFEGALEIRKVGILSMAMNIGASIAAAIAAGVVGKVFDESAKLNVELDGGVSLGVTFIILSFIFAYGASLREEKKETEENEQ